MVNPKNYCAGGFGNCLNVKMTNACNAKCEFCVERNGLCPAPVPVDKLIEATMAEKDLQTVMVLGGEPLLYKDIFKYLDGIREKEHIYLTTNGSLLDREAADCLSFLLSGINISVHHYSEFLNDEILGTKGPDFAKLRECIKVLHGGKELNGVHNPSISVRFNVNLVRGYLDTPKDIQTMIRWACYMGADEIHFSELQNYDKLWVDSRVAFPSLPEDPYTGGCEHLVETDFPIRVLVKMVCGRVCGSRPVVDEVPTCSSSIRVLYPDGIVRNGWVNSDSCHPKEKN